MVPERAPDDGRDEDETEVWVMLLPVRILLLLQMLLADDAAEFPNGAGNPLAGD